MRNNRILFMCRFLFGNWFEQGPRTSYRYSLTRDRISPVFDCCVIDYLFAQVKYKICYSLNITFIISLTKDVFLYFTF